MKSKTFPIMRYAEVLLNYVEALNELGSNTYTDEENGITAVSYTHLDVYKRQTLG